MRNRPGRKHTNSTPNKTGEPPPPPQTNSTPAVNPQPDGKDRQQRRCRKLRTAPVWIEAFCAVAIVIITGFYTHYASQQADAAIKASRAAESAANTAKMALSNQRAYVTVDSVELDGQRVYIIGRNTGITEAVDVRIAPKILAFGRKYNIDEMVTQERLPPPDSIGDIATATGFRTFKDLTDDNPDWTTTLIGLKAGQMQGYVYGTITYLDVFSNSYNSKFCFTYFSKTGGFFHCPPTKFMQP